MANNKPTTSAADEALENELSTSVPKENAEADNSPEMRVYELGFHIDAELSQEEIKKTFEDLKELATLGTGTIVAEGEPGKMQLAYTISRMSTSGRRDFDVSYFGWIVYENDGSGHTALLEKVGEDKRIIRFLDVRTTKDAAKHSAEMHEFYRNAPEVPEEEDANAPDVELDAALKEVGVV